MRKWSGITLQGNSVQTNPCVIEKSETYFSYLYFYAAVWNRDKCIVCATRVEVKIKILIFSTISRKEQAQKQLHILSLLPGWNDTLA